MKPLINKINFQLQATGSNGDAGKLAGAGDTKYLKGALFSFINKSLTSVLQVATVGSVIMLAAGVVFGPTLMVTGLFVAAGAVLLTLGIIGFNMLIGTIPKSFKLLKDIKVPASPQASQTKVITTVFVATVFLVVPFLAGLAVSSGDSHCRCRNGHIFSDSICAA